MVSANSIIFGCAVVIFSNFGHSLVKIAGENKDKVTLQAIIHHTIDKLFRTLNLNKVTEKPNLNKYNLLNKYFTTLTLEGNKNVNEIARLTEVNSNRNSSLVDTINDVLGGDDFEIEKNETNSTDMDVENFIHNFLIDLQQLTQELDIDKVYMNVNEHTLKLIQDLYVKVDNASKIESGLNKIEDNDDITSDNEFWEPSGRRIYKGERTKITHFPFMASIQIFNQFHCAGSIIKSDLIITASSCLQLAWNNRFFRENPAFLTVRVGSSFYDGGGEVISVLEVYFHPGYNPKTLKNNICILRLVRQIKFRRRVKKIKKIDFDRHDSNLPFNTPGITVVGWGAKEHSPVIGNPWINIISYAILDVYPQRDCQDVYSRQYVTNKNFCAGFLSRGGGACNRDVGGPGIVDGKLMGVISFGSPVCGTPDSPTVFTKVGYYTDWIEEIMEQNVPVSKKRTTLMPTVNYEFITQTPPKPTTFKIPPIIGKTMSPIPIAQIDSLRIIDEKVFKEFLDTMFNSKEIKQYEDIIKDDNTITVDNDNKNYLNELVLDEIIPVTDGQNIEVPHTEILDVSDDENGKSKFDTAYTVMDQENNSDFNKEMSKLIDNVDLERIVKEEVIVSPKIQNGTKSSSFQISAPNENIEVFLSEGENNVEMITEDKTKHEGMSIPDDIFEDLTRAKDNSGGLLPESVLYELLSEVMRDEVENINVNSCRCFLLFLYYSIHYFFYCLPLKLMIYFKLCKCQRKCF